MVLYSFSPFGWLCFLRSPLSSGGAFLLLLLGGGASPCHIISHRKSPLTFSGGAAFLPPPLGQCCSLLSSLGWCCSPHLPLWVVMRFSPPLGWSCSLPFFSPCGWRLSAPPFGWCSPFIVVLHLRVCGSHGESRTSDGRCFHWLGGETARRAHSRDEARCEAAALSPGEHGQEQSVDFRQKRREASLHRSVETYKTEYQPDAAGRDTAMLMGVMQPVRRTHPWTS